MIDEEVDLTQRGSLEKKIVGALRSCIQAHGPIVFHGEASAAKRVIAVIKEWNKEQRKGTNDTRPS